MAEQVFWLIVSHAATATLFFGVGFYIGNNRSRSMFRYGFKYGKHVGALQALIDVLKPIEGADSGAKDSTSTRESSVSKM